MKKENVSYSISRSKFPFGDKVVARVKTKQLEGVKFDMTVTAKKDNVKPLGFLRFDAEKNQTEHMAKFEVFYDIEVKASFVNMTVQIGKKHAVMYLPTGEIVSETSDTHYIDNIDLISEPYVYGVVMETIDVLFPEVVREYYNLTKSIN